jgi:uncharacterized delta-60 repeat protein
MGGRVGRSWFAVVVAALLALLLVGPAAALAKVSPGELDKKFGAGGKTMVPFPAETSGNVGIKYEVPFQFTPGHVQMATAPDGKIVIAGSTQLVRLLANGKLDRSFGAGGVVQIERPAGLNFVLADVAVDRQGRILVAGSVRPQASESTPDPLLSSAMVRRYAANGAVDTGFGNQGALITSFGIQPPLIGGRPYKGPSVGLRSMVIDSQNRPVLSGGSVSEVISCTPGGTEYAVNTGFVARLTETGAQDLSFADHGVRQISDLGSFAQGHLLANGNLLAVGSPNFSCSGGGGPKVVLTGFEGAGNLNPNFGFSGFRSVSFNQAPALALAPSGKILLLGSRHNAAHHKATQDVMRLLPDGAIDPGFGRTGRIVVVIPRTVRFAAIGSDAEERVLLAGRAAHKLPKSEVRRSTFVLSRLKPKATFDRSFGKHGSVLTGFGGPSSSSATQVLAIGGGRILVGGLVSTPTLPTGGGFAIARYLGGR